VTVPTTRDLRWAVELSHGWHGARSIEELAMVATDGLCALIGCDVAGWNELDRTGSRYYAYPSGYLTDDVVSALPGYLDENPIVSYIERTARATTLKFSDFLTAREYRRTRMYAEYYRARGVADQLSCPVAAGWPIIALAFNRSRRTFGERERTLLELVRPHLAVAYEGVRDRQEAARRISLLERAHEQGVALLGIDGKVEPLTDAARHLIDRWLGDHDLPSFNHGRKAVIEHDGLRLTVRVVHGDPPLLLLDECRVGPRPERVRELGLTSREAEILILAGRGASSSEIARRLVVSARTVEKHLENAFQKLGVHSREEATARLLEDRPQSARD
jgi:DNA-binding CsgD family transcriptional regulator